MLTSPGRAQKHDVVACGDEVQGAQVRDGVAFEAAGMLEVELLQRLPRWEAESRGFHGDGKVMKQFVRHRRIRRRWRHRGWDRR